MLQPNAQVIADSLTQRIGLSTSILTITNGHIQLIPKGRTKNSKETQDNVKTDEAPILRRSHPWYIK